MTIPTRRGEPAKYCFMTLLFAMLTILLMDTGHGVWAGFSLWLACACGGQWIEENRLWRESGPSDKHPTK